MNHLDRMIKSERKRRYKRLKKLFKARDMARKYTDFSIPVSKLDRFFNEDDVNCNFTSIIGRMIIDYQRRIVGITNRPLKPPTSKK